ncbi:MAG: hypothetical protein ACD_37C00381G0003 [uncultured bacterium]|nr:MAG: hypothetical protein ACD_37C00381G0003 [uncultured bacterium]
MLLIKENVRLLLGAIVVLFAVVLIITLLVTGGKTTTAQINNQTFKVEVAKTETERQIGLSDKENLSADQGMLFVFDSPDYHSFWMKDMKFPIDIIYLSGEKVVTVVENAEPPISPNENLVIYQPEEKADRVLEVSAGTAQKYKITKGSVVKVKNL